jgi:biotin carboxylase
MSTHLLILGHPETYRQFLDHVGELGFRAVVINTKLEGKYSGHHVEFVQCDPSDIARLLSLAAELHARWHFDAVVTHNEFTQYAADLVARHLGLHYRDPELVRCATNKYLMKQRFAQYGVPTAAFAFLNLTRPFESECDRIESQLSYPLVVKPPTGLFSIGVRRVENREGLRAALPATKRVAKVLRSTSSVPESSSCLIVEQYIHGTEFNVDGITIDDQFIPLMSAQKFPDLFGPSFQENALLFADCQDPVPTEFRSVAESVVRAFPFPDSPFHIEVRRELSTGKHYVVEVAPRLSGMGSTIYNMMRHATGLDLYATLIEQRRGRLKELPPLLYRNAVLEYDTLARGSGEIKGFSGLEEVLSDPNLLHADILKSPGDTLMPPAYNLESIAVFYLKTSGRDHAMSQLKWLDETLRVAFEA